jgi:copper resistance protein B
VFGRIGHRCYGCAQHDAETHERPLTYDLLLTQRLVAEPELEMNFYSKSDPERGTGTGLSDIDTGIRLRYEITRKLAPHVGFAYAGRFGSAADLSRQAGESVSTPSFVFGIRVWR